MLLIHKLDQRGMFVSSCRTDESRLKIGNSILNIMLKLLTLSVTIRKVSKIVRKEKKPAGGRD